MERRKKPNSSRDESFDRDDDADADADADDDAAADTDDDDDDEGEGREGNQKKALLAWRWSLLIKKKS
jgi:hypothetical protein